MFRNLRPKSSFFGRYTQYAKLSALYYVCYYYSVESNQLSGNKGFVTPRFPEGHAHRLTFLREIALGLPVFVQLDAISLTASV